MSRPFSTESVFRALAHPTRRHILDLLNRGEKSPLELAQNFHHTQPTLSAHLRVLRSVGLIAERRIGRKRIYTVHPRGLRPVLEWIKTYDPQRRTASR